MTSLAMEAVKITTLNITKETTETGLINHLSVQITFYVSYAIIFVLGLFGNMLVCYTVYSNKAMQTVTNLFITNLALSDLLLCIICVPFTPLYTFLGRWIFGRLTCHLVGYVQATSVYVSTLTLTAIAIDRFFVIIHPFKQRMRVPSCFFILLSIWLISMTITLPYGICMQVRLEDGNYLCEETWPNKNLEIAFSALTLIMQFIIPFFTIGYCYFKISRRLSQRIKSKPGSKSAKREQADKEKKKKTNRMLIAMVAVFGICWLPLNLINLLNDSFQSEMEQYFHMLFFCAHCLAMSSTCYNPILYAWLNENFRKEFREAIPCLPGIAANRYCSRNNRALETLLKSSFKSATPAALEPREPLAEPIPIQKQQTQEYIL